MNREPKDYENSIMGCMASATTVCIMIPMDTVKTRLVTQANYPHLVPYNGIIDCAKRVFAEEGKNLRAQSVALKNKIIFILLRTFSHLDCLTNHITNERIDCILQRSCP